MIMKHPIIYFVFVLVAVGCEKLSEGVIREIPFPEHEAQIAPTVMLRPVADTLVTRAHYSVGILDTLSGTKLKDALFTLTHETGTTLVWGGESDWVSGYGHVLTDVDLADGTWTVQVEAPGFDPVTATQVMPPRIDSIGAYAYAYEATLQEEFAEEGEEEAYLSRVIDLTLTLPNRNGATDYFVVRALQHPSWQDFDEEEEEEQNPSGYKGYAFLRSTVEDDPRIIWNEIMDGYLLQSIGEFDALSNLPFQIIQEGWGLELDSLTQQPVVIEIATLSPEMALYYERLDLIENPSGGPLFTEPILAYSNFSGGYGCFGLYTSSALPLQFD